MLTNIITITLPIFGIAFVGFFYGRAAKPNLSGANKLVIDIALPCLIFISLGNRSFDPISALHFTGGAIALILLSGLLAIAIRWLSGASKEALLPCVMFANVGPVGIPLIALAFGPKGLPYSIVLLVISNLLHFTVGASIMSGRIDWRLVYANPLVWATILGLLSAQLRLELPAPLSTSLTMIGNVLVPMMLLSLGVRLSDAKVSDSTVGVKSSILAMLVRMISVYVILMVIPVQGIERGALILFACLPPAVFNFMLADKFDIEPNKVASTVIIGHILSLAFLPMGIWLALS